MKQGFIKAAAVTPKIKVADPHYNAREIGKGIEEAVVLILQPHDRLASLLAALLRSDASRFNSLELTPGLEKKD